MVTPKDDPAGFPTSTSALDRVAVSSKVKSVAKFIFLVEVCRVSMETYLYYWGEDNVLGFLRYGEVTNLLQWLYGGYPFVFGGHGTLFRAFAFLPCLVVAASWLLRTSLAIAVIVSVLLGVWFGYFFPVSDYMPVDRIADKAVVIFHSDIVGLLAFVIVWIVLPTALVYLGYRLSHASKPSRVEV